jgi:hypothetical protein
MKKSLLIALSITFILFSFKEKPVKVNPALMGNYYASDTSVKPTWILKANAGDDNKVEFYQPGDIGPTFIVGLKDSTHFKTPHEFSHTANQVTKMWSAKGAFIGNNQIELVIHISDVTTGLKLTFSFDEDQKIVYTKR